MKISVKVMTISNSGCERTVKRVTQFGEIDTGSYLGLGEVRRVGRMSSLRREPGGKCMAPI